MEHWANWTMAVILILGLGLAMGRHGQPRSPENFWVSLAAVAINWGLLYAGGFWAPLVAP